MKDLITLGYFGRQKLHAICHGLEWSPSQTEAAIRLFDLMTASWSEWTLGDIPLWRTNLSDDNTPFEFSLEFRSKEVKLRILTESQNKPITADSNWKAGLELNERIQSQPGVDLAQFEAIADLFAPQGKPTRFALWHSAILDASGKAAFKVYLNPQIHGSAYAPDLMQKALTRLHLDHAWHYIAPRLHAMGERAQLAFFSLDLIPGDHARVKIYLSNANMTLHELDAQLKGSRNYVEGADINWIKTLTGIHESLDARHIVNYFAFTAGDKGAPVSNIQIPIRWYVENDAAAMERIMQLLPAHQGKKFSVIVQKIAGRSLEIDRGVLAHVGVRQDKEGLCVIPYLSAAAYSTSTQ